MYYTCMITCTNLYIHLVSHPLSPQLRFYPDLSRISAKILTHTRYEPRCSARKKLPLRDHNSVVFETQEVILGVLNMPEPRSFILNQQNIARTSNKNHHITPYRGCTRRVNSLKQISALQYKGFRVRVFPLVYLHHQCAFFDHHLCVGEVSDSVESIPGASVIGVLLRVLPWCSVGFP